MQADSKQKAVSRLRRLAQGAVLRAVYLTEHAQPSGLVVTDVALPSLRDCDILVAIHAAGVNPSDVKYAAGLSPTALLPRIPGRDFAGVVQQGPADIVGKEVYGSGGDLGVSRNGTHAQYIALPASAVSLKPAALSMVDAAAVGVPYVTAWKALIDLARLQANETVLIIGGSGSVGRAAAQIAKWIGARAISTARASEAESGERKFAESVITLPQEDLAKEVMRQTSGRGALVILNAVGGETFEPGVSSLAIGGRMVCISASGDRRVSFDLMKFYKRQMTWYGLDTMEYNASDCALILDQLRPCFEAGAFLVDVAREMPLQEAPAAYELVRRGGTGKVVIRTSE